MNTIKVSVIVPVYNAEKFVRRMLDSLLAQTMVDFEVIMVNDGSNEGSSVICDDYAVRIHVSRLFINRMQVLPWHEKPASMWHKVNILYMRMPMTG